MEKQAKQTPEAIFDAYEKGKNYKSGLGKHGLFEQAKINERFFVGDQWYGADCGNDRPLVRHNIVKRIPPRACPTRWGCKSSRRSCGSGWPRGQWTRRARRDRWA